MTVVSSSKPLSREDTQMRGRVYLRISDADQRDGVKNTSGVDNQLPRCLELAERKGWHVDPRPYEQGGDVYVDLDLSAAWSKKRPGKKRSGKRRPAYDAMIQGAISDAQAGRKSGIIGWDADRLTRDPRQNEDFIDLTEDYGIELATVTGDYDLATSGGRLHFRIKGAIARHESEHRAERVALKHAELRAAGRYWGGQRGFGHRVVPVIIDDKVTYRVELHEEEAERIREASRRIRRGGSVSAITKEWATSGVRRPRGRLWDTNRLRELLTSPRIAGLRQNGDELVEADWPAIIPRDEWEQLRAILSERPTKKGPKEPREYLGSGIYICDLCGTPMLGQARLGTPAYACRREKGGCGRLHRMAAPLDDYVRDEVVDALASPEFRAKLEAKYDATGDDVAAELVARRDGAFGRLKQLRNLAGDPTVEFDVDDFAAARRNLDRVINETTAKLADLPASNALADLPETPELLQELWKRSDLDRRRGLVRLAVTEVIVKAPGGGTRFRPNAFPAGEERDKHAAEHAVILWRA
jgi:site-specific DNA recombinase